MAEASFTDAVRQELARQPLPDGELARAELGALVRIAGSVTVRGGTSPRERIRLELRTPSGAVARRAFALLQQCYGVRAELQVHAPGGMRRRSTYAVQVGPDAHRVGEDLALLDDVGHPVDAPVPVSADRAAEGLVRGGFLAAGSLSSPGRPAHLEIAVGSEGLAQQLAEAVGRLVEGNARVVDGVRPRVVLKSGQAIGELLTAIGATGAFLAWDDRRLRRQLRSDATRLANADTANLRRTIEAAAAQVGDVEQAVARHGWEGLDEELRAVALVRLANPAATLTELGQLLDPPLAKSAVYRRIRRLRELAGGAEQP
jgi:cell division protein WhiA